MTNHALYGTVSTPPDRDLSCKTPKCGLVADDLSLEAVKRLCSSQRLVDRRTHVRGRHFLPSVCYPSSAPVVPEACEAGLRRNCQDQKLLQARSHCFWHRTLGIRPILLRAELGFGAGCIGNGLFEAFDVVGFVMSFGCSTEGHEGHYRTVYRGPACSGLSKRRDIH